MFTFGVDMDTSYNLVPGVPLVFASPGRTLTRRRVTNLATGPTAATNIHINATGTTDPADDLAVVAAGASMDFVRMSPLFAWSTAGGPMTASLDADPSQSLTLSDVGLLYSSLQPQITGDVRLDPATGVPIIPASAYVEGATFETPGRDLYRLVDGHPVLERQQFKDVIIVDPMVPGACDARYGKVGTDGSGADILATVSTTCTFSSGGTGALYSQLYVPIALRRLLGLGFVMTAGDGTPTVSVQAKIRKAHPGNGSYYWADIPSVDFLTASLFKLSGATGSSLDKFNVLRPASTSEYLDLGPSPEIDAGEILYVQHYWNVSYGGGMTTPVTCLSRNVLAGGGQGYKGDRKGTDGSTFSSPTWPTNAVGSHANGNIDGEPQTIRWFLIGEPK